MESRHWQLTCILHFAKRSGTWKSSLTVKGQFRDPQPQPHHLFIYLFIYLLWIFFFTPFTTSFCS